MCVRATCQSARARDGGRKNVSWNFIDFEHSLSGVDLMMKHNYAAPSGFIFNMVKKRGDFFKEC